MSDAGGDSEDLLEASQEGHAPQMAERASRDNAKCQSIGCKTTRKARSHKAVGRQALDLLPNAGGDSEGLLNVEGRNLNRDFEFAFMGQLRPLNPKEQAPRLEEALLGQCQVLGHRMQDHAKGNAA